MSTRSENPITGQKDIEVQPYSGPEGLSLEMGQPVVSCGGTGKGCGPTQLRPCGPPEGGRAETVHELANVLTAMLIGAQALDWRLPPYSRLKRPVREMERNAQRGGALLQRLLRQLGGKSGQEFCGIPCGSVARAQELDGAPALVNQPVAGRSHPAPVFSPAAAAVELTQPCDRCTSGLFPKGDDRDSSEAQLLATPRQKRGCGGTDEPRVCPGK